MASNRNPGVTKISATAALLFEKAGLSARCMDRKFDRQLAAGERAILGSHDYFTKNLRERTGIPVRCIFRSHRTIQLKIEWHTPRINYDEHNQKQCQICFPMGVPATILNAAAGSLMGKYIVGIGPFEQLEVTKATRAYGWSVFTIKQLWQPI